MDRSVVYAFISMIFAGLTSVIAKQGLLGISAELGLTLRTVFVCVFIFMFAVVAVKADEVHLLEKHNYFWLGLSGITTAISWVFYYKALKMGDVATLALIDKGSVVIAIFLAWLILKEQMTLRVVVGSCIIVAGLVVVSKK